MLEIIFVIIVVTVAWLIYAFVSKRKSGPVRRHDSLLFLTTAKIVGQSVMNVLQRGQSGYRYTHTIHTQNGLLVETRIKPSLWPLMASTAMKILIEPIDDGCRLNVSTCSQEYIAGDIFGCYDRYIKDLIYSVKSAIEETEPVA